MKAFYTALVLMLVLLWVLSSCGRRIVTSDKSSVKDSTWTKYTPREIKFWTPKIEATITGTIECDPITNKPRPMKMETKSKNGAIAKADLKPSGEIEITGGCDSLQRVITALDKETFRLRQEMRDRTVSVSKPRGKIEVFCYWFTGIGITGIVIFVIQKLRGGLIGRALMWIKGLFF